jgi:predicted nucleic acid-binding protein
MAPTEEALCVCDAGPIIHLDECGCLDLLSGFTSVLIPDVVAEEVQKHRPLAFRNPAFAFQIVRRISPLPENLSSIARKFALHRGEIEALAVSLANSSCLLLTADAAARLAARELSVPAHGTIGVLVRAIRTQQRGKVEVLSILRDLPSHSTLHLRTAFRDEVVQRVQNSP